MENNSISIIEALNHLQSWLNAGEYDKVVQGAQEILEIEPGNQRALALMKQAEEKRHTTQAPSFDPLSELAVESPAESPKETPRHQEHHQEDPKEEPDLAFEKRQLFLAMLIPAVLVVLIGGGAIWWISNKDRADTIEENITSNLPDDRSYLEENEERIEALSTIATALESYKAANGAYPSISQVEAALVKSEALSEIPVDPKQGELDKAGKPFGYVYAVYSGIGGANSVYILSGLFEDSKGFAYPWAEGAPIKNYPDYRDYTKENVTFIGGDEKDVEKTIEDRNETGPTVNPNL